MSPHEKAIRDVVEQWHSATAAGDVETVLAQMAQDAMFLVPGKQPMRGCDAFEQGLRMVLKSNRIESSGEIQELEVVGDLAYAITLLTVRMIPHEGGAASVRSGYALSIFRKQRDGSWLLVRDANLLPPPARADASRKP